MNGRYQAWVIRAWALGPRGEDRLTIEEVESGRVVELHGPHAAEISGVISTAAARRSEVCRTPPATQAPGDPIVGGDTVPAAAE
ncbi:MAG TPA: hypothetical protein VFY23_04180 [Candidatus Limnocylindrales bacterium]|nr:hypothetical protein [Candidatus Limnocylindrales bacterium]